MNAKKTIFMLVIIIFLLTNAGCDKKNTPKQKSAKEAKPSKEVNMSEREKENKPLLPPHVEGEVLLKFKKDVPKTAHQQIISKYGCSILNTIEKLEVYRLKIPEDKTVSKMIDILSKDDRIKYAEPNIIYKVQE